MQKSSRTLAPFVDRRAFTSQTAAIMLSGIASALPKMFAAQTSYPSQATKFTPSEFADFLKADAEKYRSVIRLAKISID